tara:strand:- start:356 stop:1054 length:699 start_codon:yes stop_codon:yes gene_type:complete
MFKDYHFNKWTKDKEGEFFKIIGRFDCNFLKEITFVRKERLKTKRFNEQPYTYANNKASTVDGVYHALEDADNYAGQPDAEMFDAYRFNDDYKFPTFRRVAEWFELNKKKEQTWKFHDQKPNQQLMYHIDNLPGEPRPSRINSPDFKYAKDKVRFLVFLQHWEPGQIVQFGNYVHTQWKKGECVTWEWSTLPHATWNGSWTKRPALQITGTATANTWKKIKQGSKDLCIKVH